jgi:hypothetical protein
MLQLLVLLRVDDGLVDEHVVDVLDDVQEVEVDVAAAGAAGSGVANVGTPSTTAPMQDVGELLSSMAKAASKKTLFRCMGELLLPQGELLSAFLEKHD